MPGELAPGAVALSFHGFELVEDTADRLVFFLAESRTERDSICFKRERSFSFCS